MRCEPLRIYLMNMCARCAHFGVCVGLRIRNHYDSLAACHPVSQSPCLPVTLSPSHPFTFSNSPMSHLLITSGPTRQYLDAVRDLTNASSGRMGTALAQAALELGHKVTIVSGPVDVDYPSRANVIPVVSTEEMLAACQDLFPTCDGLIGAAAPCDYRPQKVETGKIQKTGDGLVLHLVETPDIVATLGCAKTHQWVVGFALETDDQRFRAIVKLEKKCCDLVVLNGPQAMQSLENSVEILDKSGGIVGQYSGPKEEVARGILRTIQERLIAQRG
jgi:phosphopantothenoylcysteine decarboxylase / phosphopantothenate---cysteine ligase